MEKIIAYILNKVKNYNCYILTNCSFLLYFLNLLLQHKIAFFLITISPHSSILFLYVLESETNFPNSSNEDENSFTNSKLSGNLSIIK